MICFRDCFTKLLVLLKTATELCGYFRPPEVSGKSSHTYYNILRNTGPMVYDGKNRLRQKMECERFYIKSLSFEKKYFFVRVKHFPQEIEKTREIIENMSEIFQNISDIFFAIYTPADFQVLDG